MSLLLLFQGVASGPPAPPVTLPGDGEPVGQWRRNPHWRKRQEDEAALLILLLEDD